MLKDDAYIKVADAYFRLEGNFKWGDPTYYREKKMKCAQGAGSSADHGAMGISEECDHRKITWKYDEHGKKERNKKTGEYIQLCPVTGKEGKLDCLGCFPPVHGIVMMLRREDGEIQYYAPTIEGAA